MQHFSARIKSIALSNVVVSVVAGMRYQGVFNATDNPEKAALEEMVVQLAAANKTLIDQAVQMAAVRPMEYIINGDRIRPKESK